MSKGPNLDKLAQDIGDNVRQEREESKQSLATLGKKAGISKDVIHKIEKGKTLPSIRSLAKIGHALAVKIREFLP